MPPPARPQADTPKKAKQGLFDGKYSYNGASPNGNTAFPEEEPVEPEPDDSLSQADEFLSELEAIINSGSLANGSGPTDKLDDELEDDSEENLLDVPTFGLEEPYTGEETNSESDFNSQSPNGVADPGG